jgi:beta-1,2-mannobiose phosphorylase / 1,2-beta-oligomannan phosphorylase
MKISYKILLLLFVLSGCKFSTSPKKNPLMGDDKSEFPAELVKFIPYKGNPVFSGSGKVTWDEKIRERGYILRENGIFHMWYTGYREGPDTEMHLGYATSKNGLEWIKYDKNPIYDSGWVEDMCVIKLGNTYYMFAEGKNDIAHLLTSIDRINWKEKGPLDIRYTNGTPITKGPYGTPSAWYENGLWYLFYERDDLGIWLATSTDLSVWTNKQDDPVIKMGPETYDQFAVAVDQVIKYNGKYYAYYHASEFKDWHEWNSCVAVSDDLISWKKYPGNPIMKENKSSPVLIYDGEKYCLYTMHPEVCIHFPEN